MHALGAHSQCNSCLFLCSVLCIMFHASLNTLYMSIFIRISCSLPLVEAETLSCCFKVKKMPRKKSAFKFKVNDLVLVKWNDGVFYYGKVSKISIKNKKCTVVFDDRSKENVKFSQVFDGKSYLQ